MTVRGTTINVTNREWNLVCVLQSNMGLFPLSLSLRPLRLSLSPPLPFPLDSPLFLRMLVSAPTLSFFLAPWYARSFDS